MTISNGAPLPPESLPHVQPHTWVRVVQTILGTFTLSGALVLLLAVLVGVVPLFIGLHPYVIISGSMEPTIQTGSLVITRAVPRTDIGVGDVIAFNPRPEAALPIVHRIVALTERNGTRYATTRGDANTGEDAEIALTGAVLKVEVALPLIGYVVYYAAQPLGTLMLVWLPLAVLVLMWLRQRAMALWQWAQARRASAR